MPRLVVASDDVEVDVNEGETILEALYRHGFAYRIGCRRGGCAICKVDLVSGEVEYEKVVSETVLSDEEKANGVCLSCRAVPVGDVTIALREEHLRRVGSLLAFFTKA
jgi:ferredoxin